VLLRTAEETRRAEMAARLVWCNPFVGERVEIERDLLGSSFVPAARVWNLRTSLDGDRPNLAAIVAIVDEVADAVAARLAEGERPDDAERPLLEALALHHLYYRYRDSFFPLVPASQDAPQDTAQETSRDASSAPFFADFLTDLKRFTPSGAASLVTGDAAHVFACFFQVARAFVAIYTDLVGGSSPMARLRADVWSSVFSRHLKKYHRGLYLRMGDVPTLVLGPTGTGKELVARAIARSRYLPFDAKSRRFVAAPGVTFIAVNLAALSPTLIEAELFGHRRGTFTGAVADRTGFLESCSATGAIFLDEIGELDRTLQVKLLRVLQDRVFNRIGETTPRRFVGKVVAATNRDLDREMAAGTFRPDFYYRLCADVVSTPSLAEQFADSPDDLPILVRHICERVATPALADELAAEVVPYIEKSLPTRYAWPGNFRELEQCVRNIMVRGHYRTHAQTGRGVVDEFLEAVRNGALTAEQVAGRYASLVYRRAGSLQEAARRLNTDSRTIKSRLDQDFLDSLD
jgi:DNA-binding NtrC family response regulator